MTRLTKPYKPQGYCALDPRAFGLDFLVFDGSSPDFRLEADGRIAVVETSGPITYAAGWCFDSYAGILARIKAACASAAEIVVHKIDSPGGDVYGCFDTSRAIRALARAAGKRLIAYTDSKMSSSAYALGSAADEIVTSSTAEVGSVGVIGTALSTVAADQAMGLQFAIITSGRRKADGNPHRPLDDEALAAMQSSVDAMAAEFFRLIKEHRDIDAAPLEAATYVGAAAISVGLVDRIASWDELLAQTINASPRVEAPASKDLPMADNNDDKDEVREALVAASESDDPEKAAKAKKALAAYDSAKAEDEEPPKEDEEEPAAAAHSTSVALAAQVQSLATELSAMKAEKAANERAEFLASRPDLSKELLKSLEGTPLNQLRAIVNSIPVAKNPFSAGPKVIPGESQAKGLRGQRNQPSNEAELEVDRRMGLVTSTGSIQRTAHSISLGVMTKDQAAQYQKSLQERK